jgi:regulator of sirC expression with transglutaminase-like and TPR domain
MEAVARFVELVDRPSEEVDLARAALAFAAVADPRLDRDVWLEELDRLAAGVDNFEALRRRLFVERGFAGAVDDYYNPDNSLLHRVLQHRRGIPISLSVVAIEVGRRAGVAVQGIGMPGHFLIRSPESGRFCDPFHRGALLDETDCQTRFRQATGAGEEVPFGPEALPVVDAHHILARMLANLAHIYRAQGRTGDLEWVLRCQRAIPPVRAQAALRLGEVMAAQGRFTEGAREIEATAERVDAAEREPLGHAARALRARLN